MRCCWLSNGVCTAIKASLRECLPVIAQRLANEVMWRFLFGVWCNFAWCVDWTDHSIVGVARDHENREQRIGCWSFAYSRTSSFAVVICVWSFLCCVAILMLIFAGVENVSGVYAEGLSFRIRFVFLFSFWSFFSIALTVMWYLVCVIRSRRRCVTRRSLHSRRLFAGQLGVVLSEFEENGLFAATARTFPWICSAAFWRKSHRILGQFQLCNQPQFVHSPPRCVV